MLQTARSANGSGNLVGGMSSWGDPLFIDDRAYRSAMNVLNRGGVVRTRPGYKKVFDLPGVKLQGVFSFKPLLQEGCLVFAADGLVYQSVYPFASYARIPNIQFNPFAPRVYFAQAMQAAQLNPDLTVTAIAPKEILMMQDGAFTRAAYWDGANSGHLDPSVGAQFTAVIDSTGVIDSITINYGGQGYPDEVAMTVQAPSTTTGTGYTTATAHALAAGGSIYKVVIDNPGAGYTFPPDVYAVGQKNGTVPGGAMVWSGDRLWVAVGNTVVASDISNPLGFAESQYATGGGFFLFTEPITAMAEVPSFQDPALAVFTKNTSSYLQSSIRDRSTWQTTADFQCTMFPGVGCVGPFALASRFGELWWYTEQGLISFNAAEQSRISSYIAPQDTSMAVSKFNCAANTSGVAMGGYENFLLVSVPYADKHNAHTWVMDQSTIGALNADSSKAWASYWTGTRPFQWTTGIFGGVPRCFQASVDYDGVNRIWEAFDTDRTDNYHPITCFLETKLHADFANAGTGLDIKRFAFAEVNVADILGPVQMQVYWAGVKGVYKLLSSYNLASTEGSLTVNVSFGSVDSYRSQTRRLRTLEVAQDPDAPCTAVAESQNTENELDFLDIAFGLCIVWTGQASVRSYRIFCDPWDEAAVGDQVVYEYGPNVLSQAFCL
jgi:hypothetical protein